MLCVLCSEKYEEVMSLNSDKVEKTMKIVYYVLCCVFVPKKYEEVMSLNMDEVVKIELIRTDKT